MLAIGAQTGPVLLTYTASGAIDALVERATAAPPLFDFTAADGVRHILWTMTQDDVDPVVQGFADVPALYIADGHHRAASAARTRRALAGRGAGEHDRVLAVAFPDDQMQILPYNRVVKDLNNQTASEFLAALGRKITVVNNAAAVPARAGSASMYLGGRWYGLEFGAAPASEDPMSSLDVSRLQDVVLAPLLGIHDVRTDKRIDFVGGIRGTAELERLVNSGDAAAAFSLRAVAVEDLMTIADAGGIMPPKSTWFEPKLRDGLLSHVV
jgi:uncharacterized protein (DUF1015 family)